MNSQVQRSGWTGAVSTAEAQNYFIRQHMQTFVKKNEVGKVIYSCVKTPLQHPAKFGQLKQKWASNESKSIVAEQKFSSFMQTVATSDSQLHIIWAGIQLEAYQ